MYIKLEKLNSNQIDNLSDLISSVTFTDKNKRIGANGIENFSIYNYSKWHEWDRNKKILFKSSLPSIYAEKSLIGWFLHLPPETGFLDLMDAWVGQTMAGTVVAYSLTEDQQISINNENVTLERGEGIKFCLRYAHEIRPSELGQYWACLMILE